MKTVSFPLLLLLAACVTSNQDKLLRFPEELSTANYVLLNPDMSDVRQEFSVCTWLKKRMDQSRNGIPWFSYATTNNANTILLKAAAHHHITTTVRLFNLEYDTKIMRDEWYHLCVSWKSGRADFYINGVWVHLSGTHPTGQIPLGGALVLGQEQDTVGGGFDSRDVFAGDLYQLNMFKRKLTLEEVTEMYYNGRCAELCRALSYEVVLGWQDILKQGVMQGGVTVEDSECNNWGVVSDVADLLVQHLNKRPR